MIAWLTALIPYLLSTILGYLIVDRIDRPEGRIPLSIRFFLAGGIGLGMSAQITFFTLIAFHQLVPAAVIGIHLAVIGGLAVGKFKSGRSLPLPGLPSWPNALAAMVFLLAFIPLFKEVQHFPWGGWDAWEVWNFKAKFIFLAGERWTNMFEPLLWRTSPHYPLLLPLANVWGWSFQPAPDFRLIPQITSLLFTFFTMGLLWTALLYHTKQPLVVTAPLVILLIPFFATMAASQYADIVMAYFLLAALITLRWGVQTLEKRFFILTGISLGCLTFTKPEGMVAALCLLIIAGGFILFIPDRRRQGLVLVGLMAAVVLSSLATAIHQTSFSPGNQTFINGLTSADHPSTFYRMKLTLAFLLMELKADRWNGIWIFLAAGMILGGRQVWRKEHLPVPLFLLAYLGAVVLYYWLNTYFSIAWWLQVSLNRILFSILPAAAFWIFGAFAARKNTPSSSPTSDARS